MMKVNLRYFFGVLALSSLLSACGRGDCPPRIRTSTDSASGVMVEVYSDGEPVEWDSCYYGYADRAIIISPTDKRYEPKGGNGFVYSEDDSKEIAVFFSDLTAIHSATGPIVVVINRDDLRTGNVTLEFREGNSNGQILAEKTFPLGST